MLIFSRTDSVTLDPLRAFKAHNQFTEQRWPNGLRFTENELIP